MSVSLNEIEIFIAILFTIFGGIVTVGKVIDVVKGWRKPAVDLVERVKATEAHLDNDNKRLKQLEDSDKVLMKALLAMVEHMRTGNGANKLEEASKLINDHLINR